MSSKRSKRLVRAMPWLDGVASVLRTVYTPILGEHGSKPIKDALVGTWLGHPLHPVVVQLPIGFWTSASLLDALRQDEAADLMIGAGLISSTGAIMSGAAQWFDATGDETPRRLGALHAMINTVGTGLYLASYIARRNGDRRRGVAFAIGGMGFVSIGGLLGGDLAYDLGLGVNHTAFNDTVDGWQAVIAESDLLPGQPKRIDLDGDTVMLVKHDHGIHAISAVCPHLGAPLDEGKVSGETVICPWHGSEFCLADGSLIHGPATAPVSAYETRSQGGQIEIRLIK